MGRNVDASPEHHTVLPWPNGVDLPGAIVKGGRFLETLGRVAMVVLDKTGTLTFGRSEVWAVVALAGTTEAELLDIAASAELRPEHPLGKAIVERVQSEGRPIVEPTSFAHTPGRGIAAEVAKCRAVVGSRALLAGADITAPEHLSFQQQAASEILVARDSVLLGAILVADIVRPEARQATEAIHRMGIRTLLLTGDNQLVADAVAKELGMDAVEADLLPDAKHARVKELVASGRWRWWAMA